MIKYRFRIGQAPVVDGEMDLTYSPTRVALPIYGNGLSKDYVSEEGKFLFRAKLSGPLKFVHNDFDFINTLPIDGVAIVHIDISYDGGETWQIYYKGQFAKTNCEIDYDSRVISASLTTIDNYEGVLAGLNKEFDLIRLAPQTCAVNFKKSALLQFYNLGDTKITNYLGGRTWEQECEAVDDASVLTGTHHFSPTIMVREINIVDDSKSSGTYSIIEGRYYGIISNEGTLGNAHYVGKLINDRNNAYSIYYNVEVVQSGYWSADCALMVDDEVWFRTDKNILLTDEPNILTFFKTTDTSCSIWGGVLKKNIYARILTNRLEVAGVQSSALSTNDILKGDSLYKRVLRYDFGPSGFFTSSKFSTTPTKWGMREDKGYYLPPNDLFPYVAVGRSIWADISIWFVPTIGLNDVLNNAGSDVFLRDAYPIHAVISVLLKEMSPNISHKPTSEYSAFLYGDVKEDDFELVITPKANVIRGEYSVATQQSPITLQSVMSMLENVYQLYWFIDGDKLRVEHIEWFRNGGSYSSPSPALDLTTLYNSRTGKPLGFGQNKVTYNLEDIPERYEFSWMDGATEIFNGGTIDILSRIAQAGNIQKVNVADYSSDLDYMMSSPNLISTEGYVLFAAAFAQEYSGTGRSITIEPLSTNRILRANVTLSGSLIQSYKVTFSVMSNGSEVASAEFDKGANMEFVVPAYADSISISTSSTYPLILRGVVLTRVDECSVPFANLNHAGFDYYVQNPYASFAYAVPRFWLSNLPAKNVRVFGENMTLAQTSRAKEQVVSFPSEKDMSPLAVVRTEIGDGQIKELSVNMQSRNIKITLRYDTE